MLLQNLFATVALAGAAVVAAAADVNISIGGEISPGVYGRVDIGSGRPPPVVYAEPVIIVQPPPVLVVRRPIYLHVPPGHSKDWRRYCDRYSACGQPVYFVRSAEYESGEHRKHGKGHGKGKDR